MEIVDIISSRDDSSNAKQDCYEFLTKLKNLTNTLLNKHRFFRNFRLEEPAIEYEFVKHECHQQIRNWFELLGYVQRTNTITFEQLLIWPNDLDIEQEKHRFERAINVINELIHSTLSSHIKAPQNVDELQFDCSKFVETDIVSCREKNGHITSTFQVWRILLFSGFLCCSL